MSEITEITPVLFIPDKPRPFVGLLSKQDKVLRRENAAEILRDTIEKNRGVENVPFSFMVGVDFSAISEVFKISEEDAKRFRKTFTDLLKVTQGRRPAVSMLSQLDAWMLRDLEAEIPRIATRVSIVRHLASPSATSQDNEQNDWQALETRFFRESITHPTIFDPKEGENKKHPIERVTFTTITMSSPGFIAKVFCVSVEVARKIKKAFTALRDDFKSAQPRVIKSLSEATGKDKNEFERQYQVEAYVLELVRYIIERLTEEPDVTEKQTLSWAETQVMTLRKRLRESDALGVKLILLTHMHVSYIAQALNADQKTAHDISEIARHFYGTGCDTFAEFENLPVQAQRDLLAKCPNTYAQTMGMYQGYVKKLIKKES